MDRLEQFVCVGQIIVTDKLRKKETFNGFLINYRGLTKYNIEKDGGVNHAS